MSLCAQPQAKPKLKFSQKYGSLYLYVRGQKNEKIRKIHIKRQVLTQLLSLRLSTQILMVGSYGKNFMSIAQILFEISCFPFCAYDGTQ